MDRETDQPAGCGCLSDFRPERLCAAGYFNAALTNSTNQDIVLRFGEQSPDYDNDAGSVSPTCGEITMHVEDLNTPGAIAVQQDYYLMVIDRWNDAQNDDFGHQIAQRITPGAARTPVPRCPTRPTYRPARPG